MSQVGGNREIMVYPHRVEDLPLAHVLIERVQELPQELHDKVKEEICKFMGEDFLETVVRGIEIAGAIPCDVTQQECVRILKERELVVTGEVEFNDNFVDDMGIGFCHLSIIPIDSRPDSLKHLKAYPTLQKVFVNHEEELKDFHVFKDSKLFCHVVPGPPLGLIRDTIIFQSDCRVCGMVSRSHYWSGDFVCSHYRDADKEPSKLDPTPLYDEDLQLRVGGFFRSLVGKENQKSDTKTARKSSGSKSLTDSSSHEDKQVMEFKKSVKGDGVEPEMSRDLFSVPKPDEIENMSDHLTNHKSGDMFPYIAVVGNEEETKESRLSRLRAFRSPYGKENKPEMRINGIILDELEGTILVQQLRDHVNEEKLTRAQNRQNKRFKPLDETTFKKPYLLVSRITGEYVPLMSSTADYTDLHFTLEDGRLLDHQTIVQSNKIPTNQNGMFELSCDYCINVKDLSQLSLKYFLSRPVMKDGFQWGAVSLTIRMSESDTPFLTPKVEAMALIRAPYTTLEEYTKDPDHADVVFTSGQINQFREMYKSGDIVDVDQPKLERTKKSSYSKSSIRGIQKGEAGPSHLAEQSGWEHLSGMRKPLIAEGVASVSAQSEEDGVDDISATPLTRQKYEQEQEQMRKQFEQNMMKDEQKASSESTEDIPDHEAMRSVSPSLDNRYGSIDSVSPLKSSLKKQIRFEEPRQLAPPDTDNVFKFD